MDPLKAAVKQHWESEPCDIRYASGADRHEFFSSLERTRYRLAPYVLQLADFESSTGEKVLEVGVGVGIDFANWVKAGAVATGIDLTERGVSLTKEWLTLLGYGSGKFRLLVADAENLPFRDGSFDIVFAYGVLHHTPNTAKAFREAYRVLSGDGQLKCMIYHVPFWTAINVWLYHGLLKMRPWRSLRDVMYEHVESPGTKAYTVGEARDLVGEVGFKHINIDLFVDSGDLLTLKLSSKYQHNQVVRWAARFYPRGIVERFGGRLGTTMHISAIK